MIFTYWKIELTKTRGKVGENKKNPIMDIDLHLTSKWTISLDPLPMVLTAQH